MECDLCDAPARYRVIHVVDDNEGGTSATTNEWCEPHFDARADDLSILDIIDLFEPPPPPATEQSGTKTIRLVDSSRAYIVVRFPKQFPHEGKCPAIQLRTDHPHVLALTSKTDFDGFEIMLDAPNPISAKVAIFWYATTSAQSHPSR